METVDSQIERAWEHRILRDLEKTFVLCTELKNALGFPTGSFNWERLESLVVEGRPWKVVAAVAVLWSSVERDLKGVLASETLIKEIEKFVWHHDSLGLCSLHFEKGMISFSKGDYSQALENFLVAKAKADASWEKICTRANILFCLENLGMPFEEALQELTSTVQSESPTPAKRFVESQMLAFKMRMHFRGGHFKDLQLSFDEQPVIQAGYYRLWLKSLPYHRYFELPSPAEIAQLHNARFFVNRDYRVRTLKGILHPDDLSTARITDFADRLYLWVWKWLLNPEEFAIEKVSAQLLRLNLLSYTHRMTLEDLYLVRNALLWIGLFDPSNEKTLLRKISNVEGLISTTYPLFEFEALFIYYCRAIRDKNASLANDLAGEIEQNSLSTNGDLHFFPLLQELLHKKGAIAEHLRQFSDYLRELLLKDGDIPHSLIVDLTFNKIRALGEKKSIHSRAMVVALDCLRTEPTVSVEKICSLCFGISKFDSFIHMSKVYNLLARLRGLKHCPIDFRVRDGFVIAEGDWQSIQFVRKGIFSKQLSETPEWSAFMRSNTPLVHQEEESYSPQRQMTLIWKGYAKREQIEKMLNRPRSTTSRILKELVKKGAVSKTGTTRNALYRMENTTEIDLRNLA